ncbi:hypothetical protein [Bradyrhizobium lupini]|uniref:hypothetical protein n=1 Tax=Rhizobium lupini TaxID=136996 RepID=UPI0034C5D273
MNRIWIAENDRNQNHSGLLTDIIKEVYGADTVGVGHHLMFSTPDGRVDEQPSIDTLIFDHDVAKKLWGDDYITVLAKLASVPQSERDTLLSDFFYGRAHEVQD